MDGHESVSLAVNLAGSRVEMKGEAEATCALAVISRKNSKPIRLTLPTAASPSRTSLTLLLGFGGAVPAESAIICRYEARQTSMMERSDTGRVSEYRAGCDGGSRSSRRWLRCSPCCTAAEG